MKKIAIYGGSFDPIHVGHIAVAKEASSYVDEVWMMPCFNHMYDKKMRPAINRLAFARLAIDGLNKIHVSNFEIKYELTCGTYDTLKLLQQYYPDCEFSLVIGQDNADTIEKWKNSQKLINEFRVIVCSRHEHSTVDKWYLKPPHIYVRDLDIPEISSTKIREWLSNGDCLAKAFFPSANVYNAVVASGLYELGE